MLGNKYLSDLLFTSVSHFGKVINCGPRSPFQQYVLNSKEVLKASLKFLKLDIPSLNLNTNSEFLSQKSRELLLFEYSPPCNQKFGFQLYADSGV